MSKRCGICGKTAVFGTMLKCASCGQYICHRHDREQFKAITVHGMGEATPLGPYTQVNYPDGRKAGGEFKCYFCRTGDQPTDMGKEKLFFVELYFQASIIMLVAIPLLAFFGALMGFSGDMVDSLMWYLPAYFLVSMTIELIALFIEYTKIRGKKIKDFSKKVP